MRPFTTKFRLIAACASLFACAVAAHATSGQDPRIIIRGSNGGGGGAAALFSPNTLVNESFTFTLPTTQSGFFTGSLGFTNGSHDTWASLLLRESTVSTANVTCGVGNQSIFNYCAVTPDKKNSKFTDILFGNLVGQKHTGTGILPGEGFNLGFGPGVKNGVSWPSGTVFTGKANPAGLTTTPEPGTLALLGTGIVGIWSRRKQILAGRLS